MEWYNVLCVQKTIQASKNNQQTNQQTEKGNIQASSQQEEETYHRPLSGKKLSETASISGYNLNSKTHNPLLHFKVVCHHNIGMISAWYYML